MNKPSLPSASTEDLVQLFLNIAIRQHRADIGNDIKTYNQLYKQMETVTQELKARADDQRRALMTLYVHPNPHVRMKAAIRNLAIDYAKARRILEEVAESGQPPTAGRAGMTLVALDRGIFKPI